MQKRLIITIILFVSAMILLPAQTTDNPALFPLLHHFSARDFAPGPVTRAEIDIIVRAGLNAPSAGNRQTWLFTVVQNPALASQIISGMPEGNILIVKSGVGDGLTNGPVILDNALAAQSMFFAAQALGLGVRQYTNPRAIGAANNLKAELGIPQDHNAIIVTRFGRLPPGVDVVSSASPRAAPETKVIYR